MNRKHICKFFLYPDIPNIIKVKVQVKSFTFATSGFFISLGIMHLGPVSPAKPHLKENVGKLLI